MNKTRFQRAALVAAGILTAAAAVGCDKVSGKYVENSKYGGKGYVVFKSEKAYITDGEMTQEWTYETEGDHVILHNPGSPMNGIVLTLHDDGSLTGMPRMSSLKKEKD